MEAPKEKQKIMIVDDLKFITHSMSIFLKEFYEVETFNEPKKAIAHYKLNRPYHALIIDMQMPLLSGHELIKQVKDVDPHQPCIIMTGYTQKENIQQAMSAGNLIRIIKKPFDLNDVLKTLQSIGK